MKQILALFLCAIIVLTGSAALAADGAFHGEADGFFGLITAEVIVKNGKITALALTGEEELPEIGGMALESLQQSILAAGTIDGVDAVAGATQTSNGVFNAIKNALVTANEPAAPDEEAVEWTCSSCGQSGNTRNFCRNCGQPRPKIGSNVQTLFQTPGSVVTFGTYPQTESGDDKTPIEWIVLDVRDGKSLLLSKYGLDVKPYNTERVEITWETCTLRSWLNEGFFNQAFTKEEKSAILNTTVDNSSGQSYSDGKTDGGNNTQDRIFLLSYAEANRYLGIKAYHSNLEVRIKPTAYAIKHRAYTNGDYQTEDGAAAGCWWLRSPGNEQDLAAYVYMDGSYCDYGNVDYSYACVRPALWIDLGSNIFSIGL